MRDRAMESRSALVALLLVLSLSAASAAIPANSCPSTCSVTPGQIAFDQVADDSSSTAVDASACGVECRGKNYPFYQFQTGVPPSCNCYEVCSTLKELTLPDAVAIGASATCGGAVTAVCPTTCTSVSSGTFGWSANDASHGPRYLGLPSAATCAQQCRGVNAVYYQYSSTANLASGFTPNTCDCFFSCPKFTNYSPIVFTNGQTCTCATASCPAPPSSLVSLTCGTGNNDNGLSSTYNCQICNKAPNALSNTLPAIINNVRLVCSSFDPVEPSASITPACTVLATLLPGQCKTFTYKNPNALGAATFIVPENPFISSTVALTSQAPLSLGPCIPRVAVSFPPGYITYDCKIVNNGVAIARNIVLNCANFIPTSVTGINPDCSIPKNVLAGESCPFSFTTQPGVVSLGIKTFTLS